MQQPVNKDKEDFSFQCLCKHSITPNPTTYECILVSNKIKNSLITHLYLKLVLKLKTAHYAVPHVKLPFFRVGYEDKIIHVGSAFLRFLHIS